MRIKSWVSLTHFCRNLWLASLSMGQWVTRNRWKRVNLTHIFFLSVYVCYLLFAADLLLTTYAIHLSVLHRSAPCSTACLCSAPDCRNGTRNLGVLKQAELSYQHQQQQQQQQQQQRIRLNYKLHFYPRYNNKSNSYTLHHHLLLLYNTSYQCYTTPHRFNHQLPLYLYNSRSSNSNNNNSSSNNSSSSNICFVSTGTLLPFSWWVLFICLLRPSLCLPSVSILRPSVSVLRPSVSLFSARLSLYLSSPSVCLSILCLLVSCPSLCLHFVFRLYLCLPHLSLCPSVNVLFLPLLRQHTYKLCCRLLPLYSKLILRRLKWTVLRKSVGFILQAASDWL